VVVRARLISSDLPAEQDSESRIGFDDTVQFLPREGIGTHYGETPRRVIHRRVCVRLKSEYGTREGEIQDLARAVIEKHGEGNPATEQDKTRRAGITLTV
jgi:hypothetical protein